FLSQLQHARYTVPSLIDGEGVEHVHSGVLQMSCCLSRITIELQKLLAHPGSFLRVGLRHANQILNGLPYYGYAPSKLLQYQIRRSRLPELGEASEQKLNQRQVRLPGLELYFEDSVQIQRLNPLTIFIRQALQVYVIIWMIETQSPGEIMEALG